VSARMTISLMENVISNAERRGLRTGEPVVRPRLADLQGAIAAISGKVELVYEGEQEGPTNVARHLIGKAVKAQFARTFPDAYKTKGKDPSTNQVYRTIVEWFASGKTVEISDETPADALYQELRQVTGLEAVAAKHMSVKGPVELGPAMEFVLEGLHQNSILSRDRTDTGGVSYRDMLKSMFSGFRAGDGDDDEDD
jgi:magnesium chelatase subunit I